MVSIQNSIIKLNDLFKINLGWYLFVRLLFLNIYLSATVRKNKKIKITWN